MWGFFAKGTPWHDPSLEDYFKRDVTKAKQLLAAAGKPNLSFSVFYPPGLDGQQTAEILQRQLAEVGVTITLKPLTVQTDFFPDAKGAPMNFFPLQRSGLNKVTRVYVPGSYGNVCTWDDTELNTLVKSLQAVQEDSPEGIKLWKQIQKRALDTAVTVFGLFGVQSSAWDDAKVGNVNFLFISTAPVPDFYRIYIKA
jgi:ABC-type transport system substrate-binding protein